MKTVIRQRYRIYVQIIVRSLVLTFASDLIRLKTIFASLNYLPVPSRLVVVPT